MVLHPFAAYKRTPYYRPNPWVPRTSGENVGRWIVNIGLIVGAVVAGRAALGGLGGNAGAGVSGALGRVAELAAAPFRWAFRAVGAVARGASDLIGGMLSGIFGGAHVGMR